jgi:undecaprenyl-diphosphatase
LLWLAFAALFLIFWAISYAALPALRHVGRLIAHVVARNARVQALVTRTHKRVANYLPVAVILIAGALIAAFAGDQFLDLAELVRAKSTTLQSTDARIHDWAVQKRRSDETLFFVVMSTVGGPVGVAAILILSAALLAFKKRFRWLIYLVVTAGGGALLNLELKRYFARARPAVAEMLRQAHGYSFPSGHAMGSTVAFGALAYLAFRATTSWPRKAAALAFALTLILAVALSRVYLGVHWISDVGAGVTAGMAWVATTTVAYETLRRIRRLRARAYETSSLRTARGA